MHEAHGGVSVSGIASLGRALILRCTNNGNAQNRTLTKGDGDDCGHRCIGPASSLAGAERSTGAWTDRLSSAWADYRAYRTTLAELRDLNDRQLSDLGMRRSGLKRIAREAVYGNSARRARQGPRRGRKRKDNEMAHAMTHDLGHGGVFGLLRAGCGSPSRTAGCSGRRIDELAALTDRELADLGISRHSIPRDRPRERLRRLNTLPPQGGLEEFLQLAGRKPGLFLSRGPPAAPSMRCGAACGRDRHVGKCRRCRDQPARNGGRPPVRRRGERAGARSQGPRRRPDRRRRRTRLRKRAMQSVHAGGDRRIPRRAGRRGRERRHGHGLPVARRRRRGRRDGDGGARRLRRTSHPAPGFKPAPEIAADAFVVPELGGWAAGATAGDSFVKVSVTGDAAGETQASGSAARDPGAARRLRPPPGLRSAAGAAPPKINP